MSRIDNNFAAVREIIVKVLNSHFLGLILRQDCRNDIIKKYVHFATITQ